MSHLDEGQLHAYLDGQTAGDDQGRPETEGHLAVCADCRRRLDEARLLRDRAGAILRAGVPGMAATPPFEEIAERKRRAEPRRTPRTMVLAWAATVALALGIGWYARSLTPRDALISTEAAGEPPATEPAAAPAVALETAPPPPPSELASRQDAAPARARTAAPAEGQPQLADRLAAAPAPVTDTPRAAQQQHATEADTRPNTRDLARLAVERAAPAGARAPPPAAQPVAAAADEAETWVPVNRAEAERRLDDQLAALPDLETVGITAREGTGAGYVRTTQRLPDGRTVELHQVRMREGKREEPVVQRAPAAEAAPAPAIRLRGATSVSANTATVEWSNSRVMARGPLPADSLRALLRRLGRAQPPEPDQLRDD